MATHIETPPALPEPRTETERASSFANSILCQALLHPLFASYPDLHDALRRIRGAYYFRSALDGLPLRPLYHPQTARHQRTENRQMKRWIDFYRPYALETARRAMRAASRPGISSVRVPPGLFEQWFRLNGHRLTVNQRGEVLRDLVEEGTLRSVRRRYAPGPSPVLEAGPADYGLYTFLGGLHPVLGQRLLKVPGSFLWAAIGRLPAETLRSLCNEIHREGREWLESHAVSWEEIPAGQEDRYALVCWSGVSGPGEETADWAETPQDWQKLVLATVAGDVAVSAGSIDQALAALQTEMILAAKARWPTGHEEGESLNTFLERCYNIKVASTTSSWMRGPRLVREETEATRSGGAVGVARVEIVAILGLHGTHAIAESRVLRYVRDRCWGNAAEPDVARMALRQLVDSDQVIWAKNAQGEDVYRLRNPYPVRGIGEMEKLSHSLLTDLAPLMGLVRSHFFGNAACNAFSEWSWLPRADLEEFVDVVRLLRDRLSRKFNREFEGLSAEEHKEAGHLVSCMYLLNRVMPVHPKEIRK